MGLHQFLLISTTDNSKGLGLFNFLHVLCNTTHNSKNSRICSTQPPFISKCLFCFVNHQAHTKIKNRNHPIKNDTSTKQIWQHLYFITSFFESSCQTSQYHDPMTAGEKITGIFLKKISTLLDLKNLLKFFRWLPLESHRWADLSCY